MFNPKKFVSTLELQANLAGFNLEHSPGSNVNFYGEHIGTWNDKRSAVIARRENNGTWTPIEPTPHYPETDLINMLRDCAYKAITGKTYYKEK